MTARQQQTAHWIFVSLTVPVESRQQRITRRVTIVALLLIDLAALLLTPDSLWK